MSAALSAGDDDGHGEEAGFVEEAGEESACADRWRAAGPEVRKRMFSLFAVSGIFIAICRHGHVLVLCDMIKSGEL